MPKIRSFLFFIFIINFAQASKAIQCKDLGKAQSSEILKFANKTGYERSILPTERDLTSKVVSTVKSFNQFNTLEQREIYIQNLYSQALKLRAYVHSLKWSSSLESEFSSFGLGKSNVSRTIDFVVKSLASKSPNENLYKRQGQIIAISHWLHFFERMENSKKTIFELKKDIGSNIFVFSETLNATTKYSEIGVPYYLPVFGNITAREKNYLRLIGLKELKLSTRFSRKYTNKPINAWQKYINTKYSSEAQLELPRFIQLNWELIETYSQSLEQRKASHLILNRYLELRNYNPTKLSILDFQIYLNEIKMGLSRDTINLKDINLMNEAISGNKKTLIDSFPASIEFLIEFTNWLSSHSRR